jgi:hypothetical protein
MYGERNAAEEERGICVRIRNCPENPAHYSQVISGQFLILKVWVKCLKKNRILEVR